MSQAPSAYGSFQKKPKDRQRKRRTNGQVVQFQVITQCDEETAQRLLEDFSWDIPNALDHFWSNRHKFPPPAQAHQPPTQSQASSLSQIFDSYADKEEKDTIAGDGLFRFLGDLEIAPDHRHCLMLPYLLGANEMAEFSREEFREGFQKMKAYSLQNIKTELSKTFRDIETDEQRFEKFFIWLFEYCKESATKRSIAKDTACDMLKITLSGFQADREGNKKVKGDKYPLLEDYIKFMRGHETKAITKDTWICSRKFLAACKDVKAFSGDSSASEAWPVLIDEYLESRTSD